ncbi:HAD family hydrolase [Anaeromyxobacter terrae]|uniref:HAD family hydrolase n=1 Tax=Anaeromyxobacter terrae TaxID=2925406 RepID=UPI001F587EE3|nr:HAD family hydrolase [Anaeromyxobacter sp. SG22]
MRVFCFDLDDTLISECEYVESGLRAVGRRLDELSRARRGASGEWLVAEWRRARPRDLFQRRLAELGLDPGWLPRLVQEYRTHDPVIALREGARDVLAALSRRGDRLALVSDGHLEPQRRKWRALRLDVPFHPVIFTDERGRDHWKPHPWSFESVMRSAPDAKAFVYVADNERKDFVAPNRLGWLTVQLRHPENLRPCLEVGGDARPTLEVDRFGALLEIA